MILRYSRSPFREFGSYLRILTSSNEDDFQLILQNYKRKFISYKKSPSVYTFEDLSEVLSRDFKNQFEIRGRIRPNHKYDRSDSIIIEGDNVTLTTELIVNPQIHTLRFDKKSFFDTNLSFSPYSDYKSYDNEYYSEKNIILSTIDKNHLKCECIAGSVIHGVIEPIFYSFVLDKPPGYKVFCEPETVPRKNK